jgi:hypothetical protein
VAPAEFATESAAPTPEAAAREPAEEVEAPAGNSSEPGPQSGTDVLNHVIDGGIEALDSLLGRSP